MKLHEQAGNLSKAIVTLVMVVGLASLTPVLATGTGEAEIRTVEPSRDWLGGIPEAPTEDWEVAFGGRLYDNWARAALTVGPEDTHPSHPPWGKKKGYTT